MTISTLTSDPHLPVRHVEHAAEAARLEEADRLRLQTRRLRLRRHLHQPAVDAVGAVLLAVLAEAAADRVALADVERARLGVPRVPEAETVDLKLDDGDAALCERASSYMRASVAALTSVTRFSAASVFIRRIASSFVWPPSVTSISLD